MISMFKLEIRIYFQKKVNSFCFIDSDDLINALCFLMDQRPNRIFNFVSTRISKNFEVASILKNKFSF